MIYQGLKYSVTEINLNFKIKVMRFDNGKLQQERLVGVSGLIDEVGDKEIVNSLITRAFRSGKDKTVCKLRRGLKIIFFSH